jgi:hypothetical protein
LNRLFAWPPRGDETEVQGGLTEREKRENLLRLAFHGRQDRLDEFCRGDRGSGAAGNHRRVAWQCPDGQAVEGLRSVRRRRKRAPANLDLTLVGDAALVFFKPSGYFVPGVHTRPLSDDDPDIAPIWCRCGEG